MLYATAMILQRIPTLIGLGAACAALAACGSERAPEPAASASAPATANAPAAPASAGASNAAAPGRVSQYSKIDACKTIEENEDEGGFVRQRCPGLAGYGVNVTELDLRQDISVVTPDGVEHRPDYITAVGNGGFNHFGDTIEWRGAERGGAFRPDAMIVRFNVSENPEAAEKETSYLIVVSLAGDKVCVIDTVRPGSQQNERARAIADGARRCKT